ncbi:MAG: hypothetical protein SOW41_08090 [Anaerococcus sp.]|nr:hypothetical protein [Peptoniphilaceae bacterium]MDY3055995.1 hypothetical protein [Anaerococcus sp.]
MKKLTIVCELLHFKPRIWRRFEISDENSIQDLMDTIMAMFDMYGSHLYHLALPTKLNEFTRANRDERGKLTKNIPPKLFLSSLNIKPNMTKSRLNIGGFEMDNNFQDEFVDDYESYDDGFNIYDINNYELDENGNLNFKGPKRKKIKKKDPLDSLKTLKLQSGDRMYFYYDYGDSWEIKLEVEKIETRKKSENSLVPKILRGRGAGIIEDIGGTYGLEMVIEDDPDFKIFDKEMAQEFINEIFMDELDDDFFL